MTDRMLSPRLPCPVCPGIRLSRFRADDRTGLELDYCQRCGGVWFDRAEVAALRQCKPAALFKVVELKPEAYRVKCPGCSASFKRNMVLCPVCRRKNVLPCPRCDAAMEPFDHENVRLDACRKCEGVWFDNVELGEIWNMAVGRQVVAGSVSTGIANGFFLPDLLWFPVNVGGPGIDIDPGAIVGGVGDAAAGAVEATGELAGSVFEAIADIISGLFDGL